MQSAAHRKPCRAVLLCCALACQFDGIDAGARPLAAMIRRQVGVAKIITCDSCLVFVYLIFGKICLCFCIILKMLLCPLFVHPKTDLSIPEYKKNGKKCVHQKLHGKARI